MNILFCHDGPLSENKEGKLFTVSYTDDIIKRYLKISTNLKFLIRVETCEDLDQTTGLSEMSLSRKNVIDVPNFKSLKGLLLYSRLAKNIIKKAVSQSDFIIARLPSSIGRIAAEEALRQKKPYLVEVVGHPFDILWFHSLKGKCMAFYESYKDKFIINNAPFALYVTKQYLQSEYPCKGLTIGTSDTSLQSTSINVLTNRLNRITKNHSKKIILGTIGSVEVNYKGQKYVIEALNLLNKRGYTNFEYQLVGGGNPYRLTKLVEKYKLQDQVIFKGNLAHDKIFEWLDSIDIYLQPSMTEGLPRSVVEAMSRAVPCIVSNCGGNPELIEKSFQFNKTSKQASQICQILQNITTDELQQQARTNFEKSKSFFKENTDKIRNNFFEKIKDQLDKKQCF